MMLVLLEVIFIGITGREIHIGVRKNSRFLEIRNFHFSIRMKYVLKQSFRG